MKKEPKIKIVTPRNAVCVLWNFQSTSGVVCKQWKRFRIGVFLTAC